MFIRKHYIHITLIYFSLFLYTCGGGGDEGKITNITTAIAATTGCSALCSAGDPIDEGGGVWQARDASCGCINSAIQKASNGHTVYVPAGNYDWGNSHLEINKAIKLIGAGTKNTIITGSNTPYGIFRVFTGTSGEFAFKISGFKFMTKGSYIGTIEGAGYGWQINSNIFEKSVASAQLQIAAINGGGTWSLFGLINDNIFNFVKIDVIGSTKTSANNSWISSAQWGTNNAIFIENNSFSMMNGCQNTANSIDSNGGARLVIRFNTFNDARIEAHSACELTVRGTRSYEIYNNTFNRTCGTDWSPPMRIRGGSHIITNNIVAGPWQPSTVVLDNRRSTFDAYATQNSQCTGVGTPSACCTGVGSGSCSASQDGFGDCNGTNPYDTNILNNFHAGMIDGYICLDQPGAGTGTVGSQTSDPIYIWNNISGNICISGTNIYKTCTSDSDCPSGACSTQINTPNRVYLHNNINYQRYHIIAGRDYFDDTVSGYPKIKQVNGSNWQPYQCPHPLSQLTGKCDTSIIGTSGYNK